MKLKAIIMLIALVMIEDNTKVPAASASKFTFDVFERCDHGTPDSIGDCTSYQTETSSCCYFKYGSVKGCVMLGKRYLGGVVYGGMEFECTGWSLQRLGLGLMLLSFALA